MAIKLYAYNMASESARLLCDKMDIYQIKHQGSRYVPRINDVVINWGSHVLPDRLNDCKILNNPYYTCVIANKGAYAARIFRMEDNDPNWFRSIKFTASPAVAEAWHLEGHTVVARTVLNGSEGSGIMIIKPEDNTWVNAPLYSKYQPKEREYRVHVIDGKVIKVQRKLRSKDLPPPEADAFLVRNTANGFRFCTTDEYPADVATQAVNVCKYFCLDFGGVDVIYKEARRLVDGKAHVVEINSAPGIEGNTVDAYATALTDLANSFRRD